MFPVERALLIINRASGTGRGEAISEKLSSLFKQSLNELGDVQVEFVTDHPGARACAKEFICESNAPALVVAGGGGGTLRAVIEGVCDSHTATELPGPERVRIGALRMGSGNLLAKHFGVPHDPFVGLHELLTNLKTGRTVPGCVMRCITWTSSGNSQIHHVVGLGGLGQFGRTPSDVARRRARFPVVRKSAARLFGIERVNHVEYTFALLVRSISSMVFPGHAEMVEIQFQEQREHFRLLSGLVMNFPIAAFPFEPGVSVHDEALAAYLIPYTGRFAPLRQLVAPRSLLPHARRFRIEKNQRLEIRLIDRECVEFFLDEDPVTTFGKLSIEVAGSLAFVPGGNYQQSTAEGVSK